MSSPVILRNKAGAGSVECAHHIKDETVCIGSRRISLYHHMVKGIDCTLYEQIGNGKQRILHGRGNADMQNLGADAAIQSDLSELQSDNTFDLGQMP